MSLEKILATLEEQGKAFHAFKEANDERLSKLEAGKGGVGEIEAKLEKINATLDAQEQTVENLEKELVKSKKAAIVVGSGAPNAEHRAAFRSFIKTGDVNALKAIQNSVRIDNDPDGGFAVPEELDSEVERLFKDSGAMMDVCRVKTAGKGYHKLFNIGGATVVDGKELEIIDNTETSKLVKISPVWGKKEAKPLLSQEAIEDMFFSAEEFVREDVIEEMAEDIEPELIIGDGSAGKTKGLLAYLKSTDADGTRAFGALQYRKTGVSAGFKVTSTTVSPADDLIDLTTDLKEKYQNNAIFLMNRATKGAVRKFKDNNGVYIWQPRLALDMPEMLLGYGIKTSAGMPVVAANSYSIAFGDFDKAVTIVLRPGLYVVRDPYSKKPNVEFIFVKRYGLMLRHSESVKLLQNAA